MKVWTTSLRSGQSSRWSSSGAALYDTGQRCHNCAVLRAAVTGDYFLTAIPDDEDRERIQALQQELIAEIGGEAAAYVHLTLQRFEIEDSSKESGILDHLEEAANTAEPAEVIAEDLIVTYHRYFDSRSVRWRVDPTPELGRLTLLSAQTILRQGGHSHWPNAEASIAQFMTVIWLNEDAELPSHLLADYPRHVMTVRNLEITRLVGEKEFETLRQFSLPG
jgi:hypothetical protein